MGSATTGTGSRRHQGAGHAGCFVRRGDQMLAVRLTYDGPWDISTMHQLHLSIESMSLVYLTTFS